MLTLRACVSFLSSSLLNARFSGLALPLQEQKTVQTGQGNVLKTTTTTKNQNPTHKLLAASANKNLNSKQTSPKPPKAKGMPTQNWRSRKREQAQNLIKVTVAVYACA